MFLSFVFGKKMSCQRYYVLPTVSHHKEKMSGMFPFVLIVLKKKLKKHNQRLMKMITYREMSEQEYNK